MTRLIGGLIVLLLLLALLFTSTATWLLATDLGTRFWSEQLQKRWPEIQLTGISGNLIDGLHVDELSYHGEPRVELRQVDTDIGLWPLLELQTLDIHTLTVGEINVVPVNKQPPVPPSNPLELVVIPKIPLRVDLQNLEVGQLTVADTIVEQIRAQGVWTDADVTLSNIELLLSGVQLKGVAQLTPRDAPRMTPKLSLNGTWALGDNSGTLQANGVLEILNIEHELSSAQAGTIVSQGQLDLSEYPTMAFDLSHQFAEPAMTLSTTGTGESVNWAFDLNGTIIDHAVDGHLRVQLTQPIRIDISKATIDQVINLEAQVFVEESGPHVLGRAHMDDLAALELGIAGDLSAEFSWRNDKLTAVTASQAISVGDYTIVGLALNLSGVPEDLRFDARWQDGSVKGTLLNAQTKPQLTIDDGALLRIGEYSLVNSDAFTVSQLGDGWQATPHCWIGLGRLCVENSQLLKNEAVLSGQFYDLELNALNPYLPVQLTPDSIADGTWQVATATESWQANLTLQTKHLSALSDKFSLAWLPEAQLELALTPSGAQLHAQGQNEQITWQTELRTQGLTTDAPIEGNLHLETEAKLAKVFVEELKDISGRVTADAGLSGSLSQLVFATQGTWTNGSLAWDDPEFALSQIESQWSADNQGWTIQGTAVPSTGGTLTLTGGGDGFDRSSRLRADLKGSGLSLTSDNWQLTAEPDVAVTIAGGDINFAGSTVVPKALIEIKTLPKNIPRPVSDVRFIDRKALPRQAENGKIEGTLKVILGDDVVLELLALKVRMTGELKALIKGGEVVALEGELLVADGSLNASGQSLVVQQGRILFTGNPTVPYVDLIAVRSITDQSPPLKVGLRISGRSDNLNTAVYSEPALSETRALSFLVLGRDFNESSETDSQQLMIAAIGFGLSQSQGVVQQLRNTLGLDELSALAAEQNDVAIVAGKRINKDLYVRYSYNALSAVGALIIRYYLTDRWRLEATNDLNSSMDILYELKQ